MQMENGKVENRVAEPIDSTTHLDCNLNSDKENMEDTVEFRLMMAYAQRRRPAKANTPKANGSAAEQTLTQTSGKTENKEEEVEEKKKKKKIWRHLKVIFKCVQPQTVEPESPQDDDLNDPMYRHFVPEDKEDEHHGKTPCSDSDLICAEKNLKTSIEAFMVVKVEKKCFCSVQDQRM